MRKKKYSDRQATDDAKIILENILHRKNYTVETRENLAEILRQIVIRELINAR